MLGFVAILAITAGAQEPSGDTVSLNDGARITNAATVQVRILLREPAPAGLKMAIFTDPDGSVVWRPFVESLPLELPAGDGDKAVIVRLRDTAGKDREVIRASILLDTTPPEAKVRAQEPAVAGMLTLLSDVPDAVAMQWTEDATRWGPWTPYLQPRDIVVSAGEGLKTILVRYRDEAGNISKPAVLRVEVKADPATPALLRQVQVSAEPRSGDRLAVTLDLSVSGISEMVVQVDRDPALPQEPFTPRKLLDLSRTGGAHRIRILLVGPGSALSAMDVAFQEGDVLKIPTEPAAEPEAPRRWSLAVQGGVLPSGIEFEAIVPAGLRKIQSDALGLARISLSFDVTESFYGQVGIEYAAGGDLRIVSGSIDAGLRLFRTGNLDLAVEAGLLYSDLDVTLSQFGGFDSGIGFRGGVKAQWHLGDRWSLEATVDYRRATYDYAETVVSGDREARLQTAGLMLGASLKF